MQRWTLLRDTTRRTMLGATVGTVVVEYQRSAGHERLSHGPKSNSKITRAVNGYYQQ